MFNWLKNVFKINQQSNSHGKHFKSENEETDIKIDFPKTAAPKQNVPLRAPAISKTVSPANPSTVIIDFIDMAGQELHPTEVLSGSIGDRINFKIPAIENYILMDIAGMTMTMSHPKQSIKLRYAPKLGKPVMVYCFDFDSYDLLQQPEIMTGPFGHKFQVNPPEIEGYQIHESTGNFSGIYDNKVNNVLLYYRKNEWKVVQTVNYTVKLKMKTPVYDSPDKTNRLRQDLPGDSIWKVFEEVRTNTQTFLSIGGNQWIKKNFTQKIDLDNKQLD